MSRVFVGADLIPASHRTRLRARGDVIRRKIVADPVALVGRHQAYRSPAQWPCRRIANTGGQDSFVLAQRIEGKNVGALASGPQAAPSGSPASQLCSSAPFGLPMLSATLEPEPTSTYIAFPSGETRRRACDDRRPGDAARSPRRAARLQVAVAVGKADNGIGVADIHPFGICSQQIKRERKGPRRPSANTAACEACSPFGRDACGYARPRSLQRTRRH